MKKLFTTTNVLYGLLITQFIFLNLFNTEYEVKSILFSSVISIALLIWQFFNQKKTQYTKLNLIIFLYLTFSCLSYLFSQTPNLGLAELTLDIALFTSLTALAVIPKKKLNLKLFLQRIAKLNIAIQSIYIFFQVFFTNNTRLFGTFFSYFDHRLIYPNALALNLIISILLVLPTQNKQNHHYIFISLGITTLLFSFSRGALLSFIICATIYFMYLLTQKNKQIITKTIIAFSLGFILFITPYSFLSKFQNQPDLNQKITFQGTEKITSVDERKQFFTHSLKLVPNLPILGYGPFSFQYIFPTVQEIPLSNSQHPHNIFLKILLERGVINLLFFISLSLLTTKQIFILYKKDKEFLPLFLSLLAILMHNLIDYNLNLISNSFLLILLLASIFQTPTNKKTTNQPYLYIFLILTALSGSFLFTSHLTYKKRSISPVPLSKINYLNSIQESTNLLPNKKQQIKYIQSQTSNNPYNSFLYNQLAHLYLKNEQPESAIKTFRQSIYLNPNNFWNPYNYLVQTINSYQPSKIQEDMELILNNLKKYSNATQLNLHYTSQSDNIIQAIQTTQNLLKNETLNQAQIKELEEILSVLLSSHKRFNSI